MYNGNKSTILIAILCVSLVHAGVYMGLINVGSESTMMMQEGGATALTMHHVHLAGVTDEVEGNAEDSAVESEQVPEPEVEKPKEETPPEPPKPEPEPDPPKEEPPKEEPKPEPEPVKQEVIATKEKSEQRIQQQQKRETKPVERKQERRNQPNRQSDTARAVQTAKSVYSESEVSVLSKPTPGYPRAARQRRMQGTVDLLVGINTTGAAQSVKIARSSGHDILDKAATKAAHGIRLKPYKINGVATPIQVKIQYVFKM